MSSVVTKKKITLADFPAVRFRQTSIVQLPDEQRSQRRARIICWTVLILAAALQTWINRQLMGGDGVSYLDIGDAYFRGDWQNAINAMWSPLYSWLTGFVLWLIKPPAMWEYPLVHFVNFGLFVASLAAFEFFLSEFIKNHRLPFQAWAARVLAYALFGWSSLNLILIRNITADYLTSIVVFVICGLLIRIRAGEKGWFTFAALGALLGLGYLGKSPMFLLAFVFMAIPLFLMSNKKEALLRLSVTFAVFVAIAAPFIVAVSKHQGHLTFSDAGKFVYVSVVNGVNQRHWQGRTPGNGTPLHPTREILQTPPVYEFASPVGGTYPPWFDRSYWYEGATPRFSVTQQAKALLFNLRVFFDEIIFDVYGTLICGLFLLVYTSKSRWSVVKNVAAQWPFVIPAVIILALYLLVHLEVRYIAPFVAVLALVLFLSSRPTDKKLFAGVTVAISIGLTVMIGFAMLTAVITVRRNQRNDAWRVATGLTRLGLQPGDQVATTKSVLTNATWARLARVRIAAEIYGNKNDEDRDSRRDEFWLASPEKRKEIIDLLSRTGLKALVSDDLPDDADTRGWQKVGSSDYYVYLLAGELPTQN